MFIRIFCFFLCCFSVLLSTSSVFASTVVLNGAGATFPYPLYLKMLSEYQKEFGIKVNYQAIGSGGGIKNILSEIVDFAASDAPMTEKDEALSHTPILHIPMVIGSVILAYNIGEPQSPPLLLSPEVIEKIYEGAITHWNDAQIIKENPNHKLPHIPIVPVYRSDGSGTTFIFTDYLSKVSSDWAELYGKDTSINWPVGVGQKGNAGVAAFIKATKGSIGYLELAYAKQNTLKIAHLLNSAKYRITEENILDSTVAASQIDSLPPSLKVSLTNSSNPVAMPIASFTWILVKKEQNYKGRTLQQAKAVKALLTWMLTNGQQYAKPLYYAPLSQIAQEKALELLNTMTYNGRTF
ncbi:MAG: phosphate ABC transporter substrate-binding protein PstS [Desulfovibrionaceae bacterium]